MDAKKNKELVVLWVSIFLIVVLIALFPFVKKGVVGKASTAPPEGYYWEEGMEPVEQEESCSVTTKSGSLSNLGYFADESVGCCPEDSCVWFNPIFSDFLLSKGALTSEAVKSFCYSQNSIMATIEDQDDTELYGFLCTEIENKGLNWVACDTSQLNVKYSNDKFVCVSDTLAPQGYDWKVCTENMDNPLQANKLFFCDGSKWVECNSNNRWEMTENNQYWCDGTKWSHNFPVNLENFYEIKLEKGKEGINVYTSISGNVMLGYFKLRICKDDLALEDQVAVCKDDNVKLPPLFSVDYSYSENIAPYVDTFDFLFLYEEEAAEDKEVGVIVVVDVPAESGALDLSRFVTNLRENQRLALRMEEEIYILAADPASTKFFDTLKLTHIPTRNVFEIEKLTERKYQFEIVPETLAIIIERSQDNQIVKIFTEMPGEALSVYPTEANLKTLYEVPFSYDTTTKLLDLGVTVSVCNDDNPANTLSLLVCVTNLPKFTLERNNLTTEVINGQEVSFLYQYDKENNRKEGYIFWREVLPLDPAGTETELEYNNFINSMKVGRRLALSFENEVYLMEHPDLGILSLPEVKLVSYKEGIRKDDYAKPFVSEKKVDFFVLEGKITLGMDFGVPPPPFKITALTSQQLIDQEVNLDEVLSWSMSTTSPVKVSNPDFGIVSVHENDIRQDEDVFKINTQNPGMQEINLARNVAEEKLKTLMYYHDFSAGAPFVKTLTMYKLFDLSNNQAGAQEYSSEFIDIFTSGNEIALKFNDEYYLVGYEGASSSELVSFTLAKIILHPLDGEKIEGKVDLSKQTISYPVSGGEIIITKDPVKNELRFVALGEEEKIIPFTKKDFSTILTEDNKIKIGNIIYDFCETSHTESKEQLVAVCGNEKINVLVKDIPRDDLNSNFLFWYKGIIDGKKQVFIQAVEPISFEIRYDWGELGEKIDEDKSLAYLWNNKYLELTAPDPKTLESYAFSSIPEGNLYSLQDYKMSEEFLESGYFVYKGGIVSAVQELDDLTKEAALKLIVWPQLLVTAQGFNVTGTSSFVADLDGSEFVIEAEPAPASAKNLIKIRIYDHSGTTFFQAYLPEGAARTILLPDREIVIMEVLDAEQVVVELRK